MIPLWLDLKGRKAVVFGAGPVGLRKANYLSAEAEVAVVGLTFVDGFDQRIRKVSGEIRAAMAEWVEWADLVVAATDDPQLNGEIAAEAAKNGKYCNRADGVSTFLIPSVVERENYKVAISTEGRSPGMAKYLRLELDRLLDPRYDQMVTLQEQIREEAKRHIPDQKRREALLWEVLRDQKAWDLLAEDPEQAKRYVMDRMVNHRGLDP